MDKINELNILSMWLDTYNGVVLSTRRILAKIDKSRYVSLFVLVMSHSCVIKCL